MTRRRVCSAALAALIFSVMGCSPAVDLTTLPPVPSVNIEAFETGVRKQILPAQDHLQSAPDSADANGNLALLYRAYGQLDAAEVLFQRARRLAPRKQDWAYYHSDALESLADHRAALAAIAVYLERSPNDIAAQLRQARLQTAVGELEPALVTLKDLVDRYPQIGGAQVAYAQALTRAERYTDAADVWQQALVNFGSFRTAHYALGQLYRRLGQPDRAAQQLWMFEVATVTDPPTYDPLMQALFQLNRSDRSLVRAAQAAKRRGDAKKALEILEQAIARTPGNMETRAALVAGYTVESQYDDATRHAQQGLEIEPGHAELNLSFGRLLLQQGRLADARSRFETVATRSPKHAAAQAWLGRVAEISGDTRAAGDAYRRAIGLDPKQPAARQFFVAWLSANAPRREAIDALTLLAATPARDAPLVLAALAALQTEEGLNEQAIASLDRGIELANQLDQSRVRSKLSNQRARLIR